MAMATGQDFAHPIRVMLVDDSDVIRRLIKNALESEPDIKIVATASDGVMAQTTLRQHEVDVIILDIEMPTMDGLTALPKLLAIAPQVRVIIASSLTTRNAEVSIKALSMGALDVIAKPSKGVVEVEQFYRELGEKIRSAHNSMHQKNTARPEGAVAAFSSGISTPGFVAPALRAQYPKQAVKAIAIASSTGGPQALQTVLLGVKDRLSHLPIFITQHMPPSFTTILAEQLSKVSGKRCVEGHDGEVVQDGVVYIAPGDFHMVMEKNKEQIVVRTNKNPPVNFCRPSADPMIESLATIYGHNLLTVVLTGMGQDGLEGAKTLVKMGGTVIAQDAATCVVWGMPKAVTEHNICSAVLPLNDIAAYLIKACGEVA